MYNVYISSIVWGNLRNMKNLKEHLKSSLRIPISKIYVIDKFEINWFAFGKCKD